jgi:hypothetical protein
MADIQICQTRRLNMCPIQQANVLKNGRTTMRHCTTTKHVFYSNTHFTTCLLLL